MKRGYKPAAQLPTYEKCMSDLTALNELMDGILDGVEALDDRQVTKRELVRDLDFTQNGIDLLSDIGVLSQQSAGNKGRQSYSLKQAMKCRALFPGLTRPKVRRRTVVKERIDTRLKRSIRNACGVSED